MEFRRFLELDESRPLGNEGAIRESSMRDMLKKGLMSGVAAAGLLSGLADKGGFAEEPTPAFAQKVEPTARTRAMYERLKDQGRYYSSSTTRKLIRMAKEGDEWAMREIAWPKQSPFHERGRPFFRNTGPHPDGLRFHSGFEGD